MLVRGVAMEPAIDGKMRLIAVDRTGNVRAELLMSVEDYRPEDADWLQQRLDERWDALPAMPDADRAVVKRLGLEPSLRRV